MVPHFLFGQFLIFLCPVEKVNGKSPCFYTTNGKNSGQAVEFYFFENVIVFLFLDIIDWTKKLTMLLDLH